MSLMEWQVRASAFVSMDMLGRPPTSGQVSDDNSKPGLLREQHHLRRQLLFEQAIKPRLFALPRLTRFRRIANMARECRRRAH